MARIRIHRPSSATVIATLALIVALGGTAGAGPIAQLARAISGDKLIKKGSLSGNRLRSGTVTSKQIKLSALGTVPSAAQANSANFANSAALAGIAGSANTANTANSANNAATANNASAVQGQSMRRFSATSMTPQDIVDFGGVKLHGDCSGGNPILQASNTSGQAALLAAGWVRDQVSPSNLGHLFDSSFVGPDDLAAIPGNGAGTATVSFADGSVTTIVYAYENGPSPGCHVFGRIIAG